LAGLDEFLANKANRAMLRQLTGWSGNAAETPAQQASSLFTGLQQSQTPALSYFDRLARRKLLNRFGNFVVIN
jgi:hypothetical protein